MISQKQSYPQNFNQPNISVNTSMPFPNKQVPVSNFNNRPNQTIGIQNYQSYQNYQQPPRQPIPNNIPQPISNTQPMRTMDPIQMRNSQPTQFRNNYQMSNQVQRPNQPPNQIHPNMTHKSQQPTFQQPPIQRSVNQQFQNISPGKPVNFGGLQQNITQLKNVESEDQKQNFQGEVLENRIETEEMVIN